MLSCYDADLSYDSHTDTFQARNRERVSWDRLRAPPIRTSPHDLDLRTLRFNGEGINNFHMDGGMVLYRSHRKHMMVMEFTARRPVQHLSPVCQATVFSWWFWVLSSSPWLDFEPISSTWSLFGPSSLLSLVPFLDHGPSLWCMKY